jgi:ubiquinone biosynthesis protein
VSNLFEIERALKSNPKNTWELPIPNLDYVTSKIIVMSRVGGFSLGDANEMEMNADRVSAVFRQMVDGLLEGAVIHGIFHGDFHAGNVFLDTDGQIGLVDFGITGRLNGDRRIAFLRYVVGLMTGDVEAQIMGLRDLGAFPSDTDVQTLIKDFQLERDDFDPLEMSEEEFVEEIQVIVRDLLAHGARIPKELMLFVKNFAYLSSVIQNLSPEMDLLAEFEKISSGFFTRNGLRVATEVGFSVTSDDISDQSFRRAAGLRDSEKTLTWDALQKRRNETIQRIPVKSVVDELQGRI